MLSPRHKETLIITGILLAALSISFYDVFFLGKTFKVTTANAQAMHYGAYGQEDNKPAFIPVNGSDAPVLEEPIYEFIKRNLQRGILPLWNPHQALGYPLIGYIQVGMFFPINFILYIFPEIIGWDIMIITRFLLAGLFTFWMMRTLRFGFYPALAASICFMLSGPMVLLQYWTANVDILAPLLIITMECYLRAPNKRRLALISVIIALTFYGGHPEHIFLVNVYGMAFYLYRLWMLRKSLNSLRAFGMIVAAYGLGLGLAAMTLLPFLYNFWTQFWSGHPSHVGLRNEEQGARFLTLALPHFFQKVPLTYQFQFAGWWGGYLGTVPLALAFISLFNRHKRGINYFFAIMGFLLVSKAYGMFYINWLGWIPIFSMVRYAIHTPHLVAFSIAVAAGMGVRTIMHQSKVFGRGFVFAGLLTATIIVHLAIHRTAYHFNLSVRASLYALGLLVLFQVILFLRDHKVFNQKRIAVILITLLAVELCSYIHRDRPRRFESFGKVPYIEFLKNQPERNRSYGVFWAFYPNTATGFEVDDFGIFFGLLSKRFVGLVNNCISRGLFADDLRPPALRSFPITYGTPFMDMLNVKYLITPSTEMMNKILINFDEKDQNEKDRIYSNEVNIYERPDAFPRTYIVHKAIFSDNTEKTYDFIRRMQLLFDEFVVLQSKPVQKIRDATSGVPVKDSSSSTITHYSANTVEVAATMENPGLLVLSDLYHPDWRVYVDGQLERMYEANNIIRAVFLEKGVHKVKFVFRPWSFYLGAFLSLLSLAIALLLIFAARRKINIS